MRRPAAPEPQPSGEQPTLPLDDLDAPVPYQLTARARRLVAPESVPALEVVAAPPGPDPDPPVLPTDLDDPHDPRSARARALRRSGMSVRTIAQQLDVDEVVVRGWIRDLGTARRRLRAVPVPTAHEVSRFTTGAGPADGPDVDRQQVRAAFAAARAQAAGDAAERLTSPAFVRGLSMVAATAEVDLYAVVVTTRDLDVARAVRAWLHDHAGADPRDVRVVLRIGDPTGADLTLHRWADALQVPIDRVGRTRWQGAPQPSAVEALVRVADPEVAARVAGWRDALLGGTDLDGDHSDVAF